MSGSLGMPLAFLGPPHTSASTSERLLGGLAAPQPLGGGEAVEAAALGISSTLTGLVGATIGSVACAAGARALTRVGVSRIAKRRLRRTWWRWRASACAPPTTMAAIDFDFSAVDKDVEKTSAADESTLDIMPNIEKKAEQTAQEEEEFAEVIEVKGDMVICRCGKGLTTMIRTGAKILFDDGVIGTLIAWKETVALVQVDGEMASKVKAGAHPRASGAFMTTAAGSTLRGRILNPRGKPLDGRPLPPVPPKERQTFCEYKGMNERTNQYRPCFTGVMGVDFAVPIGRGQTMLFQGTDIAADKQHLWPDLLAIKAPPSGVNGPTANICVCRTMEAAESFREQLEARGIWDQCTLIVPDSDTPAATMIAMNAAVTFAEQIADEKGEATVLIDLEPMHRVWFALADAAGEERRRKGVKEGEDNWVEIEGTVVRESISERRKFWFALVSRAANSKDSGSVTILPWVWERSGGGDLRKREAYGKKLAAIAEIPRVPEETKEKMIQKVKADALKDGINLDADADGEVPDELPGVPNWEIEELKSISDGHVLLQAPQPGQPYSWIVDPYRSLPRLGTDALHPALIAVDAHKLRLRMLQGRDRADVLHDTLGAPDTLGTPDRLELRHIELMLQQPAGKTLGVEDEMARLTVAASPKARELAGADADAETLAGMAARLLESEIGKQFASGLQEKWDMAEGSGSLLLEEVAQWKALSA